MKRTISVVTALLVSLTIIWAIPACNDASEKDETINIGAILPLTGSAAPYGQNAKNGIEIALKEINSSGGINGVKVKVLYRDSKTNPSIAVGALQNLINTKNINFVIGDINSAGVLAMAPIAENNSVLLLSPGASNPKISYAGDFVFRNWHSDSVEGEIAAKHAFNILKWRNAAVLYVNSSYGVGLAETFSSSFKEAGGNILVYESYEQDSTDMRTQINKINNMVIDGIYLPGWPKEMATALIQMREINLSIPILSSQGFNDPLVTKLAGNAAHGVMFTVPKKPDPSNPKVFNFNNKYYEKYNEKPGVCSASGYDALYLLTTAISSVGDDPNLVKEYLYNLKDFQGADGQISFDSNGDLQKEFEILTNQ